MLALGFSEGEDVMIDNDRLVVERMKSTRSATVLFETGFMNSKYELTDPMDVQLKPYIVVSVGLPRNDRQITLCFDAPRKVRITRGSLYRKWGNSHSKPRSLQN